MDEKIFERVEKKYLITPKQKKRIVKALEDYMEPDKYFKSGIYNIYFDTDNYDMIIKSIDRPQFKEKLRARSYDGYDKVFFEIKTKMCEKDYNVGYKRRIKVRHSDFDDLVKNKKDMVSIIGKKHKAGADLQIAKEVDYMIKLFDLKPKILVYYDRESYRGENNLRITFDEKLRYRNKNLKFTKNARDKHYFHGINNIIMEIKANGVMPFWLVRALSSEHIYPSSFSKIGRVYETIRKDKNVQ